MKSTNVSEERKLRTHDKLSAKNHNVTVFWDTVYQDDKYTQYLNVRCNICGDIKKARLRLLSAGSYSCTHCKKLKYESLISDLNWKYVSHAAGRIKLECAICGITNNIDSSSITRGSTPYCSSCQINRYVYACEKLKLTFIDKVQDGHTLLITECNLCGHKDKTHSGDILGGRFRCNGCLLNKYINALSKRNCTLISAEKQHKKRTQIYYQNSNGDKFKAAASNVLSGRFEVSLNGYWSHPHSVYLIKLQIEDNLFIYKIGTANNPEKRAASLNLNKRYKVFILESFDDRFGADKLESELHSEFSSFRLKSEQISDYTDSNVLRKYCDGKYRRVKDGVTEWFSSEVYNVLKVRYNLFANCAIHDWD